MSRIFTVARVVVGRGNRRREYQANEPHPTVPNVKWGEYALRLGYPR